MPRDYKYLALITKKPEWEECLKKVYRTRCQALHQLAEAFGINLERIAKFSIMPAEIAASALRDQNVVDYAIFETTGKIEPWVTDQLGKPGFDSAKFNEVFKREAEKLESEQPEVP